MVVSYAAAPEPGTNLLAEIEAELESFVEAGANIDLPAQEEEQTVAPERTENAQVLLEQQVVLRESEIQDPTPLIHAAATAKAGSSSQDIKDDLLLLDDALLSTEHLALQMESHKCFGAFVEVSRVPIGVEYLLSLDIRLMLIHIILDLVQDVVKQSRRKSQLLEGYGDVLIQKEKLEDDLQK